jgi:hypothetical protein
VSAEGAAQNGIRLCRAFGASFEDAHIPGLTAGPINYRPFGPPDKIRYLPILMLILIMPYQLRNPSLLVPQALAAAVHYEEADADSNDGQA